MFKKPLWQTVWTQIRLLRKKQSVLGPHCLLLYLIRQLCKAIIYSRRLQQTTFSDVFFMPPKELWEAYSNRTVRPSFPLHVGCISPIFFEVGIPNLVCGCILGWLSVVYHFRVTVTLTLIFDLAFIVITMSVRPASCPVHISYILRGRNSKFDVWMHLGMAECHIPFSGHYDLDL